ncbi:MAG: hypothetical protein OEV49_06775 [candidate division Zixibacteria bacterium]|nr:hypothetical protein [candidate division Zixibacteria bacterium]MDH3937580.1 hypothetical protein [candidate division Zixibacteria bacterium]MDH4035025.1 hypothetical protein [candidate division Zixibacteria bacterium]
MPDRIRHDEQNHFLLLKEKRDSDMEPRFSEADATYYRLCTEHILALPLVKRLHFLPALVLPAQRTFLVAAFFFFGAAFFLATFLFGAAFFFATFRFGAAFFLAGFLFGAAFFLVAFLALRIETPPRFGFRYTQKFFFEYMSRKKVACRASFITHHARVVHGACMIARSFC